MADTIVHQARTITREMITAASLLVKVAHPMNTSLHRALAKAESRLIDQSWAIVDGELHIASYSRPRDVNVTDGSDCSCPTSRGVCNHIAGWHILSALSAVGINPVAALPLPSVLDEDNLPGDFLDQDFSAFDDESLTGHDEYGDVIPAPAPAFVEVVGMPVLVKRRPAPFVLQPSVEHFNPLNALTDELFAA